MIWRNTESRYGGVAKFFHWTMAGLVLVMVLLGFYMHGLSFSPFKLALYDWHKSLGTLILFLFALRLLWRVFNKTPSALITHKPWEKALAHIIHYSLYALLLALPVTGWLMSSAGDFSHNFFGLFAMPDLVAKDEDLFRQMRQLHGVLVYVLLIALFLHISGAFKHHIIDRDITLARMIPFRKEQARTYGLNITAGALAGTVFVFYAIAAMFIYAETVKESHHHAAQTAIEDTRPVAMTEDEKTASKATSDHWVVDYDNSRLSFYVDVYGEPFEAVFPVFDAVIVFDPEALEKSRAKITIPIAQVKSGSQERDGFMVMAPWFNAESFPESKFVATEFKKTAENQYVATGELTIRGVTKPISLPFTLQFKESEEGAPYVLMHAEATINRLDYGVGQGEWAKTETVANEVVIKVSLRARRSGDTE